MKSKFIILSIMCIMFVSTSTTFCQSKPEIATARIIDTVFGFDKPRIIVAYGDKEGEIIPLKEYRPIQEVMNNPASIDTTALENQKLINKFYQDMEDKGFRIQELEMSVNGGTFIYVVFRKE